MLVPTRAPADETVEEVVDLFHQFRNPLLRYVSALGLSLHDGEEVVQDVFLALFQHLKQGKPRTNLKGWLFRVAHNLALRQRMRNGRKDQLHAGENCAEEYFAPELNPEEEFAGAQRRQRLLEAAAALTETDRCCLYLRAEGLRYRQIAEVVGISLGGVSLSLARSLNRLAEVDGY
jgi:RNA polymerase sigma-70 factor (ECF subfamily)